MLQSLLGVTLTDVLIAESNDVLRLGIKSVLRGHSSIFIRAEASTEREILSALSIVQYDVILIELKLFQSIGITALRFANPVAPTLKVLVHSHGNCVKAGIHVLKSGGMGFLTKHSSPSELTNAILTLSSGKPYVNEALVDELAQGICYRPGSLPHLSLASRELEVFKMLVIGMSVSAIAVQLDISPKTVSTYKVRIMNKMNLPRMSELVQYAIANKLL